MREIIENQIYQRAKRRIAFRIHATIYLLVIGSNWLIWQLFPTTHIWPIWPTLGWGIGLWTHYIGAVARYTFFNIDDEVHHIQHQTKSHHES